MDLKRLLETHRDEIMGEWVRRILTEVSERYSRRPAEEVRGTISEATEAYFAALTEDDFLKMDRFISKITAMRLDVGFTLSEVQGAFELYRTVLVPILLAELDVSLLPDALDRLNRCLSHTIRRFSDHFQAQHEQSIREHAEDLERMVRDRTRELKESEAKYRMLVEEINDGYFVSREGRLIFANRAFCEMHGYSVDEVIGRHYMDFVAPESRDRLTKIHEERASTGGAPDQYVYLRLHRDGRKLYSENKVKVITYEGETVTAGICRDVTERVELEKQTFRLVELENERKTIALSTLRQLMVTLSHYLLNANAIIGGMARRCNRAASDEERQVSLDAIREQTGRTEGVIAALKRMAEIRTTEYTPESHTLMIDLTREIEETLAKTEQDET
ncbi:MAG: cyclic-di-GMP phosphodiesterase [Syntrophorhabdus sp. PtaB.Bin184]|nr:MAG: cyclic-di-GMP phosphodiesterase [Syntrophorhabdus sp. PtaB.Bin184]